MAGPVTHIVLAWKIWNESLTSKTQSEFYSGVSFPDIRYLKVISRDRTHFPNPTFEKVLGEPSSFFAGVIFHNLTDIRREKFLDRLCVYSFCLPSKTIDRDLKLFEDELLYERMGDWEMIKKDFQNLPQDVARFGVSEGSVKHWYSLMRDYVSQKPNYESRARLLQGLGLTSDMIDSINKNIELMREDSKLTDYVQKLYGEWSNIISSER